MLKRKWFSALSLAIMSLLLLQGTCDPPLVAPENGSVQFFYEVDVDSAVVMGLSELETIEVSTTKITVKLHSNDSYGPEYVLDDTHRMLILPARTQIITGSFYEVPAGYITQVRIYFDSVKFSFSDGSSRSVRVPSGEQTGWKVTVDESTYPNGYEIASREVTGIKIHITLHNLFHQTGGEIWMAKPTITSELYNIVKEEGYDPDKAVVSFDPSTPQATIDNVISGGNFTVDFSYTNGEARLYKLDLPPNMSLQDAYAYFNSYSPILTAIPSVKIFERQLAPNEGTPPELDVLSAETGWDAVNTAIGAVGNHHVVLAELTTGGFNMEHRDLWRNIWINQAEVLAVASLATGDMDNDGLITFIDFNDPNFPAVDLPPDANGDGNITPVDLLHSGSQYVNGIDENNNTYIDDLCGWDFVGNDRFVTGASDHNTGVTGIMGAVGNNGVNTAGVCWNVSIMPIRIAINAPQDVGSVEGRTAELIAGLLYARDNNAHVANLSAGLDIVPEKGSLCPNRYRTFYPEGEYPNIIAKMNKVIADLFNDLTIPTPLYVLAGGECSPGISDAEANYYDFPPEAFASGANSAQTAITVAATANTAGSVGGLASYSNYGQPFQIAAPGNWADMLNGGSNTLNNYSASGTSFAAPTVAGVAGLIVAGNFAVYGTPDGDALKAELLANHTSGSASGIPIVTMLNLP